ncbi:hypothetical protein M422DRAFT_270265 [Sphaerobolus stellatus SS14]|uniref:Uncharacterized protein n=1 Tax=Sphaerobolus stellatus (strain SS14) TaxID=990650 RepID=A0A0C9UHM6_SPHS4|nr:hypothetical protein M422DRAFT_270265 [Sphaerobolus stellatus SS14]
MGLRDSEHKPVTCSIESTLHISETDKNPHYTSVFYDAAGVAMGIRFNKGNFRAQIPWEKKARMYYTDCRALSRMSTEYNLRVEKAQSQEEYNNAEGNLNRLVQKIIAARDRVTYHLALAEAQERAMVMGYGYPTNL